MRQRPDGAKGVWGTVKLRTPGTEQPLALWAASPCRATQFSTLETHEVSSRNLNEVEHVEVQKLQ